MTHEDILTQIWATCTAIARDSRRPNADPEALTERLVKLVSHCRADLDTSHEPAAAGRGE